jgi:hypothetical protein
MRFCHLTHFNNMAGIIMAQLLSEEWKGDKRKLVDHAKGTFWDNCLIKKAMIDGEYQVSQFRGEDVVVSPTFPELRLTTKEALLTNS